MIRAPFSPDQVRRLNAYQSSGKFHPFTCPRPHGACRTLIAECLGWVCSGCDYAQDWAHDFMASTRWDDRVTRWRET